MMTATTAATTATTVSPRLLPVPDGLVGERVDVALSRMTGLSRSKVGDMCSLGAVRLDGVPVGKSDPKRSQDLTELLGCGDIRDFDPDRQWKRREGRDRLKVPFGVTPVPLG